MAWVGAQYVNGYSYTANTTPITYLNYPFQNIGTMTTFTTNIIYTTSNTLTFEPIGVTYPRIEPLRNGPSEWFRHPRRAAELRRVHREEAHRRARYVGQAYQEAVREAAREIGRETARARARELLLEILSDEQRIEMQQHERFFVRGSRGRRYCIRTQHSMAGNIAHVDEDGTPLVDFCCHPNGVPLADGWITQALGIMHDEDAFLAVANKLYLAPERTQRHLELIAA